ncbi:5-hydroxytryptamine receptor 4-like [Watersipora subatra]|uniref:5-hydroxytryptamine receptor 4-like n=1 Tax=Watersipora subatra TaxID=2589382 RepID=UPI00355B94A3
MAKVGKNTSLYTNWTTEQDSRQQSATNLTTLVMELGNTPSETNNDEYMSNERLGAGLFLMMSGLAGISLNLLIFGSVCLNKQLRRWINGFIVHECVLDAFKSALCIPYSLAVLKKGTTKYCMILGLAYVVALTVSMFNLLAMVMVEAYIFHEHNVGGSGDTKGTAMCVLFGIVTIYIGSVILHLGPTLIGGQFEFNSRVGNCIFAYGDIQNYIVQVIWIIIISLTIVFIYRYIYKIYRQLKANQRFRITNLARNAAAYTKGQNPNEDIYDLVNRLKKRVRVLLCMTTVYCVCWYPLFFLTLLDQNYKEPAIFYRVLTIVAWSHSTILPLIFLSMDNNFGIIQQIRRAVRMHQHRHKPHSSSTQPLTRADSNTLGSTHTSLYNRTMNSEGQMAFHMDSPIMNPQFRDSNTPAEQNSSAALTEPFIHLSTPTSPSKARGTRKLSEYDGFSLEESPL